MATWTYPTDMHPWFRTPSLKRKLTDVNVSVVAEHGSTTPPPTVCHKRRRCDVLERGLARLTLAACCDRPTDSVSTNCDPNRASGLGRAASSSASAIVNSVEPSAGLPTPLTEPSLLPTALDLPSIPIIFPSSVDEPTSPGHVNDQPDVHMKIPSWYEVEKDRIVITELEDSDLEEDLSTSDELFISPALLGRLPRQLLSLPSRAPKTDSSRALVLFKPPIIAEPFSRENKNKVDEEDEAAGNRQDTDADTPMDIQADDDNDMEIELL
ncbi:uncharacterized protein FIBRA_08627 [Fibroporia radiculosa]|uniref:Uncharacterized protein n=1 Tax=Fibroporia radiculosa TaxID=599839 RepID=J4H599_9APHY|nr:uncharacterized protein FIBRA_08627 [Fibroporia radiculosa]CCM06369.1 predicted protein [Fibroporia radiculosa]